MPKIYERWILGVSLRFGNYLAKMCSFAEFTDQNWTFAPIYRKSTALESKPFWW